MISYPGAQAMGDNVVDFDSEKHNHQFKRKEAKADAIRQAFRQARGESDSGNPRRKKKSKKRK
ncbi:MAG TPA: hypothetical protein QGI39_06950 [Gammaproteobacteria bacterium]|jgi:hypothetical protein|nr:hypothetical protein [Gammaproteobacteria bacterium]|tara:strand:+ start:542 stop:730 length:189 start_codon:yes stop_codon:yes gene_type:complete